MKTSLIFGGTKGIGLAMARMLAVDGNVIVCGRSAPDKDATGKAQIVFIPADVTDSGAVKDAIGETVKRFGRLDRVVNSAGYGHCLSLDELNEAEWVRMNDVTVNGNFYIAKHSYDVFLRQKTGHFLIIGSLASGGAWCREIGYGTFKGAQVKFALHLLDQFRADKESGRGDFQCHVLCPGSVYTDFWSRIPQRSITRDESLSADEVATAGVALLENPDWGWKELRAKFQWKHVGIGSLPPFDDWPQIVRIAHQAHP